MKVFEFADYEEFIRFGVSERLYGHGGCKKSNLMRVSKDLGYASTSLLSMVMSGKRIPSEEMCESLLATGGCLSKKPSFSEPRFSSNGRLAMARTPQTCATVRSR